MKFTCFMHFIICINNKTLLQACVLHRYVKIPEKIQTDRIFIRKYIIIICQRNYVLAFCLT